MVEYPPITFPTLGHLQVPWIEAHCVVPDGFDKGTPFLLSDWQAWGVINHYRVKPGAKGVHAKEYAAAFAYRRSQTVRPQKVGKGPFTASVICLEAVGPALMLGWAEGGEVYDCRDYGCGCGFVHEYEPGDPMGTPWPTPLIQITATSEEQTDNIYDALRPMIDSGPLSEIITKTGEEFIRLPGGGRIDTVTSNARSRLGARVTFVPQDETGLWTATTGMIRVAETQRRGLAGMGGRAWETTNAWDPSENSVAQRTYEAQMDDIFYDFPQPPTHLSFGNKTERRRILRHVYAGSPWVNLDDVEGEVAELMRTDPQQAERFFGNRLVYAKGAWMPDGLWSDRAEAELGQPADGAQITLGFDGSENNDWTAIRAETVDGYQFTPTYGPDKRPTIWNPDEWGGAIPRAEVHAAVDELFTRYNVARMYCDPQDWRSEIGEWALEHGEKVVAEWATNRPSQMYNALRRFEVDLKTRITHDSCPITALHVANSRKKAVPGQKYILTKPADHQKIDAAMASVLAHEAAADAIADGWKVRKSRRVLVLR